MKFILLPVSALAADCQDSAIGLACTDECHETYSNCRAECDEVDCSVDCNLDLWGCLGSCPCFDQCPSGCEDCAHPLCTCVDPESDEDFVFCRDYNELAFRKCTLDCMHDNECFIQCNLDFEEAMNTCPCNEGCPNGCPCPDYECVYASTSSEEATTTTGSTTTMTTNSLTSPTKDEPNHILVLNTALTRNEPVLITEDEYDLVQPEINFTFGASTESFSS